MNNCEWLLNMTYEQREEWLKADHANDDMDNAVNVQKRPNDSREKLEADVRDWAITTNAVFPENRVKSVKGFLDRQAAITHSIDAWNIKRLEEERESLQTQVDELQAKINEQQETLDNDCRDLIEYDKALNAAAGKWAKADARCSELQAALDQQRTATANANDLWGRTRDELEAVKAEREAYRSLFGKSLDLADEIRALGADCDTGVAR